MIPDTDWMDDAACAGRPTEWWFPPETRGRGGATPFYAKARTVCQNCPVIAQCDHYANTALTYAEAGNGMWAARTPRERRRARRELTPARGDYGHGVCPHCSTVFIKRHAQAVLCGALACEKASATEARARHQAKKAAS